MITGLLLEEPALPVPVAAARAAVPSDDHSGSSQPQRALPTPPFPAPKSPPSTEYGASSGNTSVHPEPAPHVLVAAAPAAGTTNDHSGAFQPQRALPAPPFPAPDSPPLPGLDACAGKTPVVGEKRKATPFNVQDTNSQPADLN